MTASGVTLVIDTQTGLQTQGQGVTYLGLPVLGVSFVRYVNGALVVQGAQTLSNYGVGGPAKNIPIVTVP